LGEIFPVMLDEDVRGVRAGVRSSGSGAVSKLTSIATTVSSVLQLALSYKSLSLSC